MEEEDSAVMKESFLVTLESDETKTLKCGEVMELESNGEMVKFMVREIKKYKDFVDLLVMRGVENVMPGYSFSQALEAIRETYPHQTGRNAVYVLRVVQLS